MKQIYSVCMSSHIHIQEYQPFPQVYPQRRSLYSRFLPPSRMRRLAAHSSLIFNPICVATFRLLACKNPWRVNLPGLLSRFRSRADPQREPESRHVAPLVS